ncbi:hypothetical protein PHYC_00800 [Phycisphaerales bacterium]|nr:hypothetical protein PHYC_00800 [Phycisphaerales bacterium]
MNSLARCNIVAAAACVWTQASGDIVAVESEGWTSWSVQDSDNAAQISQSAGFSSAWPLPFSFDSSGTFTRGTTTSIAGNDSSLTFDHTTLTLTLHTRAWLVPGLRTTGESALLSNSTTWVRTTLVVNDSGALIVDGHGGATPSGMGTNAWFDLTTESGIDIMSWRNWGSPGQPISFEGTPILAPGSYVLVFGIEAGALTPLAPVPPVSAQLDLSVRFVPTPPTLALVALLLLAVPPRSRRTTQPA